MRRRIVSSKLALQTIESANPPRICVGLGGNCVIRKARTVIFTSPAGMFSQNTRPWRILNYAEIQGTGAGRSRMRTWLSCFSSKPTTKPGPKGPAADLIWPLSKQRNPNWGCPHIADEINLAFGNAIRKDAGRQNLAQHLPADANGCSPSWAKV